MAKTVPNAAKVATSVEEIRLFLGEESIPISFFTNAENLRLLRKLGIRKPGDKISLQATAKCV